MVAGDGMSLAKRLRGMFRSKPISLVASVNPVFQNGVTSVSQTIPSLVQEGDFLIACVMARSLLVEIPNGWLQAQVTQSSDNVATTQYLYVLVKTATSSDAFSLFTATQSASGRMAASITVFRSVGSIRIAKITYQSNQYQIGNFVNIASIQASEGVVFAAASWVLALNGESAPSAGWSVLMQTTSSDTANSNRMCIAYQQVAELKEYTGNFNIGTTSAPPHTSACSLNLVAY